MTISKGKLISKIQAELDLAKTTNEDGQVRERLYAIKALCELMLDTATNSEHKPLQPQAPLPFQANIAHQVVQPPKMEVDESSNGDSLFDF